VTSIAARLDGYDIGGACQALRDHLEVLTNWYIRRSRNRFWAGEPAALDTLWTVLEAICRVAAPLLPLTTEAIWRGLTGGESVHLQDWPDVSDFPADEELAGAMDLVRAVCSTALSLRKAHQLRVRLPLASLTIAHPDAASLAPFTHLIADEVNVKAVELAQDPASLGRFELAVNPRMLGPRVGAQVQQVIRAVKAGEWAQSGDGIAAAGVQLEPGEYDLKLAAADPDSTSALPGNAGLIALDLRVTPELAAEGTARDVVRIVQQARREAGLDVSDRIRLTVGADGAVAGAVRAHAGFVAAETLAADLEVRPSAEVSGDPHPVADTAVRVALSRVPS
jgi:isoleucyl-tRNA synthetase